MIRKNWNSKWSFFNWRICWTWYKNELIIKKIAKDLLKKQANNLLDNPNLINFAKFYSLTSNFELRNKNHIEPLKKIYWWNIRN
ncbi:hypothetical protein I7632_02400 [Mycoplasma mycoides subsp. capri]|nr:hypothetical protein [Mycoplasma mycoides]QVJ95892.1 hypothetical protein I7632_02400 [Mycoplasma mycoides subsp. capri]